MRRIRIVIGLWLLAVSIALGNPTAASADSPKRAVTNVDSIRRFMEKGQALFIAGQHQRAAEVFEAGYELHPYSAFLFNAGVALEKSGKLTEALERFKKYLEVDVKAPDAVEVRKRIARVEQAIQEQSSASTGKTGASGPQGKTPDREASDPDAATKSLVIVETEPPGAPIRILRRVRGDSTFSAAGDNPDWIEVLTTASPANASLDVGQYQVQVEKHQDFNAADTSFEVLSGHVLQVKVNLAQGQFMGHLRVTSNVTNARVFVDDPAQKKPAWGRTPLSDFVSIGEHSVLVVATGHEPVTKTVSLDRGEQKELRFDLQRVSFGGLRVSSNVPNASVVVDGLPVGTTVKANQALEVEKLKSGKHHVRITAEGRKPLESEVEVPRGQILPIHARLVVVPPRGAAYAQAIISGVLLGGGIYFGLESNRLYDEIRTDHAQGSLASDDPRELRGKIYSISADVAFLGSAALAGLSTYSFLRDPLPPSRLVTSKPVEFGSPSKASAPATRAAVGATSSARPPLRPPHTKPLMTAGTDTRVQQ